MGLFKSKRDREIEKKLLIKKTMANLNKYVAGLEEQKMKYIKSAKRAKQINSDSQYSLAVSGLKTAYAQQKRAQEMLLNFELTSQMKDLTSMTSVFLKGMSSLSKDMAKITSNNDFIKVQQQFEKAMTGVEDTSDKLDMFLDVSDKSFESLASKEEEDFDEKEFEKMIDAELLEEETKIDSEIDKKLKSLNKSNKEEN